MAPSDYLVAAGWLVGWALFTRTPRLPRAAAAVDSDGVVTVVIPARNEAATLPHLLGDLAAMRSPNVRVVVVDDGSEDGTAEVARAFPFVEVVSAPPRAAEWLGKTWACHLGTARAETGMLAFLDADVRLSSDALARVVGLARRRGGLVTVWPHQQVERPYEHVSALPTLVTMMCVGCGSLLPPARLRCGFGAVMACSVANYRGVGGHAAVRADVVEDFAIARRFADAGLPVEALAGGDDVWSRMYPDGVRSLLEGWTKSLGRGVAGIDPLRLIGVLFWLTCAIGSLTWATGLPRRQSLVFLGLFAAQFAVQFRRLGTFSILDGLLYPLHVAATALLFTASLWMTYVRRCVRWRGRDVTVASAATAGDAPRQRE